MAPSFSVSHTDIKFLNIFKKKLIIIYFSQYIMNNLSTEYTHEFKVCGATRSIYNGSIVLYGEFSKTHQVCD